MRTLLAALLLVAVTAPADADTCPRRGNETRCSDRSATRCVSGRWLYQPSPEARVLTWTWPFIIPSREVRSQQRPRLMSP